METFTLCVQGTSAKIGTSAKKSRMKENYIRIEPAIVPVVGEANGFETNESTRTSSTNGKSNIMENDIVETTTQKAILLFLGGYLLNGSTLSQSFGCLWGPWRPDMLGDTYPKQVTPVKVLISRQQGDSIFTTIDTTVYNPSIICSTMLILSPTTCQT